MNHPLLIHEFFNFSVTPIDYEDVSGLILDFQTGSTRVCHNITINQDEECEEPPETFTSVLTYESGVQPISVVRNVSRIIIVDSGELECSKCCFHK